MAAARLPPPPPPPPPRPASSAPSSPSSAATASASAASNSSGSGNSLLSDASKHASLMAAIREKGGALDRALIQASHTALFAPFRDRLQRASAMLRLLQQYAIESTSSLPTPPPRAQAALYGTLGCIRLACAWLEPLLRDCSSSSLAAHARDGGSLVRRKLDALLRLLSGALHELNQACVGRALALRRKIAQADANADDASLDELELGGGGKQYLSTSVAPTALTGQFDRLSFSDVDPYSRSGVAARLADSSSSAAAAATSSGWSAPPLLRDDYFGQAPLDGPYASEAGLAARKQRAQELLQSYRAFPPLLPPSACAAMGQRRLGVSGCAAGSDAAQNALPLCGDLFTSPASPLSLPADFIPSLRVREFRALQAAFARLCVSYASGSNLDSNPRGPRVIFLHGEAGTGVQSYARFVLRHLMDPPSDRSATGAAAASTVADTALSPNASAFAHTGSGASSTSTSGLHSYGPTAPPSYTSAYVPLHFEFSRHAQYRFERRAEGMLDALKRKLKSGLASKPPTGSNVSCGSVGGAGEGGSQAAREEGGCAVLTECGVSNSADSASDGVNQLGSHGTQSRSAIPPLEKEKHHRMHRLRVDAATVAKSLLPSLLTSPAAWGEVESAQIGESELLSRWRRHVLDAPLLLLLSNVHLNDEAEIQRLLFPPRDGGVAHPTLDNKAIVIVQSRQRLKGLMRACATHSVAQQLLPLDDAQSMSLLLKLSERRALLRLREEHARRVALLRSIGARLGQHIPEPPPPPPHAAPGSSLSPGHAIRLAALCRGSPFVARLLARQLECPLPLPSSSSSSSPNKSKRLPPPAPTALPERTVAEWWCGALESTPSPFVRWLVAHFFPSSMKPTLAPALATVFSTLSPGARELFVTIAFALAANQSFSWRTLRALLPSWGVDDANLECTDEPAGEGVAKSESESQPHAPFRPGALEDDVRELLARGLLERLGEFDLAAGGGEEGDAPSDEEDEHEEDEAPARDQASLSLDEEAGGESSASLRALLAHPPPAPLFRARFRQHELLKEFGLALAHGSGPGAADYARFMGARMATRFCTPESKAASHRRALQLNLVSHYARLVATWDAQFEQWWGTSAAAGAAGSEGDDEHELEEFDSDDDSPSPPVPAPASIASPPAAPGARKLPPPLPASYTPSRVRAPTIPPFHPSPPPPPFPAALVGVSEWNSPGRGRAESSARSMAAARARQSLVASLVAQEEAEARSRAASRRPSVRGRVLDGSAAPPPPSARRSTLLLASRARNESSTLPRASFASLPAPAPTELVFKTVRRLRVLAEEDGDADADGDGEAEDGPSAPVDYDEADAAVLSSTPPLRAPGGSGSGVGRSPSPKSSNSSSSDSLEADADGEEDPAALDSDDSDEDATLAVIPLAAEDDLEPEAALNEAEQEGGKGEENAASAPQSQEEADAAHLEEEQERAEREEHEAQVRAMIAQADGSTDSAQLSSFSSAEADAEGEYDAAAFSDSDASSSDDDASDADDEEDEAEDADSSSDDAYEDAEVGSGRASRAASTVTSGRPAHTGRSSVAALLLRLQEDDRRARRQARAEARRAQQAADAARRAEEEEERRRREAEEAEVSHHPSRTPRLSALLGPTPNDSVHHSAESLLRLLVPSPEDVARRRARRAARMNKAGLMPSSPIGRSRAGTRFSAVARNTPSFIRRLQLASLLRSVDLELSGLVGALQACFSCSRRNLSASLLLSPRSLYSVRLGPYALKSLCFRYLEVVKPRYSREWQRALWHLLECYRALGSLSKARDCAEELRLVAERQGSDGARSLVLSMLAAACVHQSQLRAGVMAPFGSAVENDPRIALAAQHAGASAGSDSVNSMDPPSLPPSFGAGAPSSASLMYPHSLSQVSLLSSASSLSLGDASLVPPSPSHATRQDGLQGSSSLGANSSLAPLSASAHVSLVLQALVECWARALACLESSAMTIVASGAGASTRTLAATAAANSRSAASALEGMRALTGPFVFLLLRLANWHALRGAFQNAAFLLTRALRMLEGEIAVRREQAKQAKQAAQSRGMSVARVVSPPSSPLGAGRGRFSFASPNSSSFPGASSRIQPLFPFRLPSLSRLAGHVCFALAMLYFRMSLSPSSSASGSGSGSSSASDSNSDPSLLVESLRWLERSRRVFALVVARRWRGEKAHRDHSGRRTDRAEDAAVRAAGEEGEEEAWALSTSFLSSLATPAHVADILDYVRAVYMQSVALERLARGSADSSPSAGNGVPHSSIPASWCAFQSLVLRWRIVGVWTRVSCGARTPAMYADMWRILAAGMSAVETA